MKIYCSIDGIPRQKNSILTIGTFDGIHLGHRKIIDELVRRAQKKKVRSVLITFSPHPQTVLKTRKPVVKLLTTVEEKIQILDGLGMDVMFVIPFSLEIARMEPLDFVKEIVVRYVGVSEFIIGYNHAFGKERKGEKGLLQQAGKRFGFSVDVVPPVEIAGKTVSSTRIRNLLAQGRIREANSLLGRNYSLEGRVVRGNHLGREIGFPTANIRVMDENKLVPSDGVYAVFVHIGEERRAGMMNIGFKPTVAGTQRSMEIHIHDFSGDLYNHRLKIECVDRIRNEIRFDSVNTLASQMAADKEKTIALLSKHFRR